MRIVAVMLLAATCTMSAARAAPVDDVFRAFGLFGSWASDCGKPASPANPHVSITLLSPGLVLESHDLGPDYTVNRYSILSAERLSADELAVEVMFQPGGEAEEREKLIVPRSQGHAAHAVQPARRRRGAGQGRHRACQRQQHAGAQ